MAMTKKLGVKLVSQTPGYCGPASLKMVLDYYGVKKSLETLAKMSQTPPAYETAGASGKKLLAAAKKLGFSGFIKNWADFNDIRQYVEKRQIPVIISWFSEYESHFSVVVKIDDKNIYFLDPEYETLRKMSFPRFKKIWFEFEGGFQGKKPKLIVRRIVVIYPKPAEKKSKSKAE